jgi:hypothetical protein
MYAAVVQLAIPALVLLVAVIRKKGWNIAAEKKLRITGRNFVPPERIYQFWS